ncbi:hypothetical protein N7G274_000699 [Stereocaulon virgatum]|uniref:Uncharacterized protein n=1 Tax=Stereocaulon virgatum TaxID=373712 RepID=A0ABR4AS40_9LECA
MIASYASEHYIGPQPILVCLDDRERDVRAAYNKTLRKLDDGPDNLFVRWASHDRRRDPTMVELTDHNAAPMLKLLKARGGIDRLLFG